ncbi:MAG: biopolymer transporter ExbD [Pirellulales bacterium]|nr:biopolymer transporter ExbD [Pirellulales bacterium]
MTVDESESPVISRTRQLPDAEMDITPMIDCVFLLLIFFVVCSTMEQQSPIELAKARHGKGVSERDSIIISVGAGGVDSAPVYLADDTNGEPVPGDLDQQREAIRTSVEQELREEGKQDVIIKADRNVAHRDVSQVIKAVSQVDGVNIHLAVFESE